MKLATPILALVATLSLAVVAEAQTKSGSTSPTFPSPTWQQVPGLFTLPVQAITKTELALFYITRLTVQLTDNTQQFIYFRATTALSAPGSFPACDPESAPLMIKLMTAYLQSPSRSRASLEVNSLTKWVCGSSVAYYVSQDTNVRVFTPADIAGELGGLNTPDSTVEGILSEFVMYGKSRANIPNRPTYLSFGKVSLKRHDAVVRTGHLIANDFTAPNMMMYQKISSAKVNELVDKIFQGTLTVSIQGTVGVMSPTDRILHNTITF